MSDDATSNEGRRTHLRVPCPSSKVMVLTARLLQNARVAMCLTRPCLVAALDVRYSEVALHDF
jgi:hypothetical protein